jgi:hypothetical protein
MRAALPHVRRPRGVHGMGNPHGVADETCFRNPCRDQARNQHDAVFGVGLDQLDARSAALLRDARAKRLGLWGQVGGTTITFACRAVHHYRTYSRYRCRFVDDFNMLTQ